MVNGMIDRLEACGISPSEKMGQHFLIDDHVLDIMAQRVGPGNSVIEIGAGPGNLTERLMEHASHVVAVELDRRYEPFLEPLSRRSGVEVMYADALAVNLYAVMRGVPDAQWELIASLPFHISEPFLRKVAGLPFENMVLLIGDSLARSAMASGPDDPHFSKLSLLCQTYFDPVIGQTVPKHAFYPQPRTDAAVVDFFPSPTDKFQDPKYAIYRALFNPTLSRQTVAKVLAQTFDPFRYGSKGSRDKRTSHRQERRTLKRELRDFAERVDDVCPHSAKSTQDCRDGKNANYFRGIDLPDGLLSKPFSAFSNDDVRLLALTLERRFR